MRKLLLILLLSVGYSMAVHADENDGIMLINDTPTVTVNETTSKKSENLMKDAQWYLKRKEFAKAKSKLEALLVLDSNNAQAKVLLEKCNEEIAKSGDESINNNGKKFAMGAEIGADFFKLNFGIHIGMTMRYGRYTDLFNLTAGVDFIIHQSYKSRDYFDYTSSFTLGGQLAVPVLAQFNVLKCTENSRFYIGTGPEFAVKLYGKDLNFGGSYQSKNKVTLLESSTVAGLVRIGVAARHLDVGVYYKHYFTDIVPDAHPAFQENDRVGFNVAYYF